MTPDQIKTAGAAELDKLTAKARGWYWFDGEFSSYWIILPKGGKRQHCQPTQCHNQAHELIQFGVDTWGGTLFLWKYWWNLTFCVFGEYAETKERNVLLLNTTPEQKTRAALLAICELEGNKKC